MDKLQPLIRHKFWIIFALTLPVVLFAYYSTSGKMAEATTTQESALQKTLDGVPKGDTEPNETYAAGAQVINEELEDRFETQVQKLWELQTERMTWPKVMVDFIPQKFRGEIADHARYQYMRAYPAVVERVWERVQPYVGDQRSNPELRNIKVDWEQKVIIDGLNLPHAEFDMSAPAENDEIWDAQEDIWLLELIFDAIVRTNSEAQFVSDAPVRQIDVIELVAGTGTSIVMESAGGGGGYADEDMPGMAGMGMGANMGMGAMMGGGSGRGRGGAGGMGMNTSVAFNVAEEFGPPVVIQPEGDDDFGGDGGYPEEMAGTMGMGMMASVMGGGGGAMQPGAKLQRYIGPEGFDAFEGPYRERGFYMSVIVLQERIPDFLAELSSSPWPIRIGRFHIGPNPYAPQDGASRGGGFGMAGLGGGRGRGVDDDMTGSYFGGRGGIGGMAGMPEAMMGGLGMSGMGFGGRGGGRMGRGGGLGLGIKLPRYMAMPSNIPPSLRADPDLVQMDLCGIITLYNPVTDDTVEVEDDGSTAEDFEETLEQAPESPEEAKVMAAEEAAAAAEELSEAPAADGAVADGANSGPVGDAGGEATSGEAATDPASSDPAATSEATPPVEPADDGGSGGPGTQ